MIVGGDYRKPNDVGATAAITSDGGKTWTLLDKPIPLSLRAWPGRRIVGSRSARRVPTSRWTMVHTWKLLDRENYNSVGFTSTGEGWAVGPKGRIARFAK